MTALPSHVQELADRVATGHGVEVLELTLRGQGRGRVGKSAAGLRIVALAQPFWAMLFVYSGALRGLGNTRFPLRVNQSWSRRVGQIRKFVNYG